jgi:hypothetical protein
MERAFHGTSGGRTSMKVVTQIVLMVLSIVAFQSSLAAAAGVRPMFDLSYQAGSPFPSDRFAVRDSGQNTGLRINLPKLDCTVRITDCEHIVLLNERRLS